MGFLGRPYVEGDRYTTDDVRSHESRLNTDTDIDSIRTTYTVGLA
jgi:hypothetical protein